ncbi:hypothetical protein F5X97DRAFT_212964 [Nemania serpens]|nr:hypothetical protein F5X97DRAFT_212964 [Nemania serpens]
MSPFPIPLPPTVAVVLALRVRSSSSSSMRPAARRSSRRRVTSRSYSWASLACSSRIISLGCHCRCDALYSSMSMLTFF